ncbi:UNVERIFIED_CONTAM: CPBP family intramembrane metalloprotease [Streptococcus canis]
MIRIVLFYLAIQLNGLLVSLYLEEYMTIKVLILLQMLLLGVACLEITHHKTVQAKNITLQNCLRWLLLGFACMLAFAVFISFLFPVQTRNQAILVQVEKQIPHVIFLFFLVNASVLEEVVYRQLLWEKLTFPYCCLGLTLAVIRLKTDCMTAITLHLLWNSLVSVLTFL